MKWYVAALIAAALLASTAAFAASIAPSGARAHIGQTVTVDGRISEVHFDRRSGTTFLDLDGRYPANAFTGVIFAGARSAFPDAASLEGRIVDITGTIDLYRGKPEIILKSADQVRPVN